MCPALGRTICPVCCGSKRQVEIDCPPGCGYLAAAQAHPPATVRRQQERDLALVMAMSDGLVGRQSELLMAMLSFVAGLDADPLLKLLDEDVAEGAGALAATYETAERGLIYEHHPQSLPAQRFVTDAKTFLSTLAAEADAASARRLERDAAVVLRRLEAGLRGARQVVDEGPATGLTLIGRFVAAARARSRGDGADGQPAADPPRPLLVRP
jgi:hypothetical protein